MNFDLRKLDKLGASSNASQKAPSFKPKFLGRARPQAPGEASKTQGSAGPSGLETVAGPANAAASQEPRQAIVAAAAAAPQEQQQQQPRSAVHAAQAVHPPGVPTAPMLRPAAPLPGLPTETAGAAVVSPTVRGTLAIPTPPQPPLVVAPAMPSTQPAAAAPAQQQPQVAAAALPAQQPLASALAAARPAQQALAAAPAPPFEQAAALGAPPLAAAAAAPAGALSTVPTPPQQPLAEAPSLKFWLAPVPAQQQQAQAQQQEALLRQQDEQQQALASPGSKRKAAAAASPQPSRIEATAAAALLLSAAGESQAGDGQEAAPETKGEGAAAGEEGPPAAKRRRGKKVPPPNKAKPAERAAARKAKAAAKKAAAAVVDEAGGEAVEAAGPSTAVAAVAEPSPRLKAQAKRKAKQQTQQATQVDAASAAAAVLSLPASTRQVPAQRPAGAAVPLLLPAPPAGSAAAGAGPSRPQVYMQIVGDKAVLVPVTASGLHMTVGENGQLRPSPAPIPAPQQLAPVKRGRGRPRKSEQQQQQQQVLVAPGGDGGEGESLLAIARRCAAGGRQPKPGLPPRKKQRVLPLRPPKINPAADLDVSSMSLKEIVAWGNARERKLAEEERQQKRADSEAGGGGGGGEAGPSTSGGARSGGRGWEAPEPSSAGAGGGGVLAPQVQVVDGRIVVNQQSLTVQAQAAQTFTRVVREDTPKLNNMTYMRTIGNERWSPEDTELFYKALSQFGTDFTLICHLFPGRHRRHLKNKFNKESRSNPTRVDNALRASANATIHSYKEMVEMLRAGGMVGEGAGASSVAGSLRDVPEEEDGDLVDGGVIEREAIAMQTEADAEEVAGVAALVGAGAGARGEPAGEEGAAAAGEDKGGAAATAAGPPTSKQQQEEEGEKEGVEEAEAGAASAAGDGEHGIEEKEGKGAGAEGLPPPDLYAGSHFDEDPYEEAVY